MRIPISSAEVASLKRQFLKAGGKIKKCKPAYVCPVQGATKRLGPFNLLPVLSLRDQITAMMPKPNFKRNQRKKK